LVEPYPGTIFAGQSYNEGSYQLQSVHVNNVEDFNNPTPPTGNTVTISEISTSVQFPTGGDISTPSAVNSNIMVSIPGIYSSVPYPTVSTSNISSDQFIFSYGVCDIGFLELELPVRHFPN
jgi:hypothetical protein